MQDAVQRSVDYYLDPCAPLLRAIIRAEGGPEAFLRAIRCSFPQTADFAEALARGAKTIRNRIAAYGDFFDAKSEPLLVMVPRTGLDRWTGEPHPKRLRFSDQFIAFLGARWAPVGVANDPTGLNRHWVPNVKAIYAQELQRVADD